ncbi:MAG TPA: hypothetical protein VN452_02200 [Longilinea sp.]|nr:hypothetical protein [Longilinea sp.]
MAKLIIVIGLFISILSGGKSHQSSNGLIPITGNQDKTINYRQDFARLPSLREFIPSITNGNPKQLVGVFINQTMALRVVQQPASNPGFVSSAPEVVTQFSLASQYGTIGLLAHNTAAGQAFDDIHSGQKIILIYGNGDLKYFMVEQIRQFQALSPTSPYSNFTDLANSEKLLSAENLFYQIYQSKGNLVFQTCIERDNELSWGRLFVIAHPIGAPALLKLSPASYLSGHTNQPVYLN